MIKPQHTRGKWFWKLSLKNHPMLVTNHSGQLVVLDSVRSGMQGTKFRTRDEHCIMRDATPDHPDMQLIARAPEMFEALQNIRMLVASRKELRENQHGIQILEFCRQGGVEGSILRGE